MESVEEMCDYIALIHKGEKLLDGEITNVKKSYRSNRYEVGIKANDVASLELELQNHYNILPAKFKSLEPMLKCTLQVNPEETANELLQYLISKGTVNHFKEVIPSINDIFIQNVTTNA